jgi:hypothetical protein
LGFAKNGFRRKQTTSGAKRRMNQRSSGWDLGDGAEDREGRNVSC